MSKDHKKSNCLSRSFRVSGAVVACLAILIGCQEDPASRPPISDSVKTEAPLAVPLGDASGEAANPSVFDNGLAEFTQLAGAEFPIRKFAVPGCSGGRAHVAEFDFGDPAFAERFEVRVLKTGMVTFDGALNGLKKRGLSVAALINAGYFDMRSGAPVSYYRSSLENTEHPTNSARSPRACLVWTPDGGEIVQSTTQNYQSFRNWPGAEIFCAGPQTVLASTDVSRTRACDEQFTPGCRSDRTDPGLNFSGKYPRAAVCLAGRKKMLLFSFESSTRKCGVTIPALAQAMIDQGCTDGINLDGGGSVKLFLDDGTGHPIRATGDASNLSRRIPVWVSIVRRPSPR